MTVRVGGELVDGVCLLLVSQALGVVQQIQPHDLDAAATNVGDTVSATAVKRLVSRVRRMKGVGFDVKLDWIGVTLRS